MFSQVDVSRAGKNGQSAVRRGTSGPKFALCGQVTVETSALGGLDAAAGDAVRDDPQ